ncbi:MAG: hypothetical protein A3F54_05695 [Candidatus Kerfeldbacteria bacterium RIFCSPHIGHO2_12_FULL_48_17]|uniref:Hydrolase TatD n=1 Tax=Candidatus Kerfeldbacteria bacterium RIFCSPHIGHO2_12_FULL_48_17 TaxID=1798542 RepID=A0A1G2B5X2_9BACT|nr:MAG: hypothetical protein A3F54_05695 [Candidatus Kerfeldbacteria bacterium RIFCSPHIGHO2_12_FULL_48_17]
MSEPLFFDAHAHVTFAAFEADAAEVIERTLAGETWLVNVSTQLPTSQRAVKFAHEYDEGVYAAVGLHPTHVLDHSFDRSAYLKLAQDEKVVAIGEVGMDYYRMDKQVSGAKQEEIFRAFIEIAIEVGKPLIVHCRDAYDDLYRILSDYNGQVNAIIHCFVGNDVIAQKFLDLGFTISFTGIITFTDNEGLLRAVKQVPMDRFTIETDCPYLAPLPHRGQRNEPLYVKYIADKVAELKGMSPEDIAAAATRNARKFFKV